MQTAFHIGQLVRIVRPSTGLEDSRTFCVVCMIPPCAEGEPPCYLVKNMVGAELLVWPHQIRPASQTAIP